MESMGKTLQNLFKSYCLQLLKLDLLMAGKNDLVAVEEAALKSMFTQKVRYKSSNAIFPIQTYYAARFPFQIFCIMDWRGCSDMMYSYIPFPDMVYSRFKRTIIDAFHCFGKSGLWVGVLWCGVVWCDVL
jgi:hypothetical protein